MNDVDAIIRLTYEYAFANDTFAVERLVALFAEDAIIDMTAFGMQRYEGTPAIRRYFEKEASVLSHLMHVTSNHRIDVEGDAASGDVYFLAIAITREGNENQARGHYEDRYVRTPAGWRFAARTMLPLLPYASVREARSRGR